MTNMLRDKAGDSIPNFSRDGVIPPDKPPTRQPSISVRSDHLIFPYLEANGSDQITPLIRLAAEKYRHLSLSKFSTNLTIRSYSENEAYKNKTDLYLHPPSWCHSIRDASNKFLGWEVYYFDISGTHYEPIPLEVRLLTPKESKHGNATHPPGIRIRYQNVWLRISTFLDHYPPARFLRTWTESQTPESLWDSQWRWWVALSRLPTYNPLHKKFRILDLPAEIRELIYSDILGSSPFNPFPKLRAQNLGGLYRDRYLASQPDLRVMLLNKQIHSEIRRVLLCDMVWLIPRFNILDRILISPYLSVTVQRLHLALSHSQFLQLFANQNSEFVVRSLRPMRWMRLRELVLDMAAPPSVRMIRDEHGTKSKFVACQKLIVGWILAAAEYWVVGHQGVKVVGWVREKQKREFEGKCREGLRELAKWREMDCVEGKELWDWDAWREDDGGVRLLEEVEDGEVVGSAQVVDGEDGSGEVQDFRMLSDHWGGPEPPECFCEVSCASDEWSAVA